jgi:hypothetical protein
VGVPFEQLVSKINPQRTGFINQKLTKEETLRNNADSSNTTLNLNLYGSEDCPCLTSSVERQKNSSVCRVSPEMHSSSYRGVFSAALTGESF